MKKNILLAISLTCFVILLLLGNTVFAKGVSPPGMVLIPKGEFIMGHDKEDEDEKPQKKIFLKAFYIDINEVTNAEYQKFVEATGHRKPYWSKDSTLNQPNQPVVGVSWDDAAAYAKWAGKRLPTEAEWEKAARGTDGRIFPWGDKWDKTKVQSSISEENKLASVSSHPSGTSIYGANDMAGNAWEWCQDWYDPMYYTKTPLKNPQGPSSGETKVTRGGSWIDMPQQLRSSNRYYSHPYVRTPAIGFRCAKDAD